MPNFWNILEYIFNYLGYVFIFYMCYSFSRYFVNNTDIGKLKTAFICIGISLLIGLYGYSYLGTHQEGDGEDSETVRDYRPSEKEKMEHGIERTLLFLIPFTVGFFSKKKY